MPASSKHPPKLGGLYERLLVPVGRYPGGLVEHDYAIIREVGAEWRQISEYDMGCDPLFLWDIVPDENDEEMLYYHFLWKGRLRVFATLAKNEDFFKWFDVWWRLREKDGQ